MMAERPILFSAEMVLAILKGDKTQTRRKAPIRELNILQHPGDMLTWSVSFLKAIKGTLTSHSGGKFSDLQARSIIASQFNPYGRPGDLLWVRETFCAHWGAPPHDAPQSYRIVTGDELPLIKQENGDLYQPVPSDIMAIWYGAQGDKPFHMAWRPSIHMPRWASRITLRITDVRVERLQDISEDDAVAEGVALERYVPVSDSAGTHSSGEAEPTDPVEEYRNLWNHINAPGAWGANPWVWVIEFEKVKP